MQKKVAIFIQNLKKFFFHSFFIDFCKKKGMIKNQNQNILFDNIQKVLPANRALVDVVSDLLNISTDAAYRRIRGVKSIDFDEAILLCNEFKISLDAFVNAPDVKQIQCGYTPLDINDTHNYVLYLQNLFEDIEKSRISPGGEIFMTAASLPAVYYFRYRELTLFNLFSWSNSVYGFSDNYSEFVNNMESDKLAVYHEKIVKSYHQVPSHEIWTTGTIDRILTLINHHYEVGHFSDENFPLLLCEQLLELLATLQGWMEKGEKGENNVPHKFYVSDIDFDNSFFLFKSANATKFFLKLFTINGLTTTDERFCTEIENWINNTMQRSTLISGSSEKERYKFFNSLKQKIRFLIDKVYQSNLKEWVNINKKKPITIF